MRHCDTCGCELEEGHPFTVCPKCLFGAALASDRHSRGVAEVEFPSPVESWPRLFTRRDFFQKYDILERRGQGGQGDVWKVWDFELRRCVAMKRLGENASTRDASVYRFLAEAQIASQLEHPGILPILEVGLDPDGRPFYTTQLLPGTTLGDIWRQVRDPSQRDWTVNRGIELLLRICDVMAHAHSRGVIHRDLKPANVLVGAFGDVRVIDWGSAHVLEAARESFEEPFVELNRWPIQTDRGEVISLEPGSPLATAAAGQPITILFMPPEILRGQMDQLGPATDVYSIGVMLYELLAGRLPYARADGFLPPPAELREQILREPPTPVRHANRAISRDLAAICEKAMARVRADRYRTMQELGDDLRAALEVRPVQARRPGPFLRLQRWLQRHAAQALLATVTVLILSAAFFMVRAATAQRDLAEQMSALRSAELDARSGHWREALRHWAEAEAAGYTDAIHLGLCRAEAWTVLMSPRRSAAELDQLLRRSNLGDRRGAVLLRVGEHELFDRATAPRGVDHVREALAAGLTGADEAVAKGLLAETTPAALELFRQALQFDPYHHSAHRHSLGLEFLLGRHQELANHIRVFQVLFPDDPSPRYLQAAELALGGRFPEAETCLARIHDASDPNLQSQFRMGLRLMAALAKQYDVEALLEKGPPDPPGLDSLLGGALMSPSSAAPPRQADTPFPLTMRVAQFPCLQRYREGWAAARSLALPLFADPQRALDQVKAGWRAHPEALLPAATASFLELQQPRDGPKSSAVLARQAEFFQLAADSSSVVPNLGLWARWQAAHAQWQLTRASPTNSAAVRQACLENIRRAADAVETSPLECHAYFDMALALGDYNLARVLLDRWESRRPGDESARRSRIQLEMAAGGFGPALKLVDEWLAAKPADPWALEQKNRIIVQLQALLDASSQSNPTHPP